MHKQDLGEKTQEKQTLTNCATNTTKAQHLFCNERGNLKNLEHM